VSAAMKRAPEPTPERAALAHAIARAADADVRKAALVKARATADEEVRLARRAVDAAGEAVEAAPSNAARHLTDTALGTAGAAPQTIREARAAAIEAADHLDSCLAAREALGSEQAAGNNGLPALLVTDAAVAVVKAEVAGRAAAMAAEVAELQRRLVVRGSALEWLSNKGVLPPGARGAEDPIRDTVRRMEVSPQQWANGTIRYATSVFEPTGRLAWEAAFEQLLRDANAPLPGD
jgi:hypothetical protein